MNDQLPPFDTESEAGALACVLIAAEPEALLSQLEDRDFYELRHVTTFRALASLESDWKTINPVSVVQELKNRGQLDEAGGLDYLLRLPDCTPSAVNFETYLATVKDRSCRRRMLAQAVADQRRALDLKEPVLSTSDGQRFKDQIEARRLDFSRKPIEPAPHWKINGIGVSTPGNLTTVCAQAKNGKSVIMGALMGAAMSDGQDPAACLGVTAENLDHGALIHIDTEQSPYDHYELIERAVRRARLKVPPLWLRSYCLTGYSSTELRRALDSILAEAGSIFGILLDGVADFVSDVNDLKESNAFVAELHAIAIKHYCPIVGVIHLNPGSENKTRGHLGSQLERKAETNLRLEKDTEEAITLWADKNRRAPIPKSTGPRFAWSMEHGMHVLTASHGEVSRDRKREEMKPLLEQMFQEHPAIRYSDLKDYLVAKDKIEPKSAEKRIGLYSKLGLIKHDIAKLYVKGF